MRHKSNISGDLTRGTDRLGYRPRKAQNLSEARCQYSRNAARTAPEIWRSAQALLGQQCSPEQIASQLPLSHDTIYQKIYADKARGSQYDRKSAYAVVAKVQLKTG